MMNNTSSDLIRTSLIEDQHSRWTLNSFSHGHSAEQHNTRHLVNVANSLLDSYGILNVMNQINNDSTYQADHDQLTSIIPLIATQRLQNVGYRNVLNESLQEDTSIKKVISNEGKKTFKKKKV